MSAVDIPYSTGWEGVPITVMDRIAGPDGEAIEQADVSSIACKVFNQAGTQVGSTITVEVASTVFDTLQTDDPWEEDETGYNFRHEIAGTYFATPNITYRIEYVFTLAAGGTLAVVKGHTVMNLLSS